MAVRQRVQLAAPWTAIMLMLGRGWPMLVLAVSLAVRLWGIDWQLPAALYFDELKYVERAGGAVRGDPPDPIDFRNPTLFWHVLEDEYRLATFVHPILNVREAAVFQLALARVTSAVLGTVACLLTGLAAARLTRRVSSGVEGGAFARKSCAWPASSAGLAAGLILALAPLAVQLSHYAVNDTAASFVMAAGLLVGTRALTAPNWSDFLLGGVLAGLASATKYNFGIVLALPLAAALPAVSAAVERLPVASARSPTRAVVLFQSEATCRRVRPGGWVLAPGYVALVLLGFALGLAVGLPEIVTSPSLVLAGITEQARLGATHWNGQSDTPIWQLYTEALIHGFGWPALLLAAGGAVALARRDHFALMAILSVPTACVAIMLRQELFFTRFALPLLPSLAVLSGFGISALAGSGGRRWRGVTGVGLVLGALLIVSLPAAWSTIQIDQLATTTDTRILAQRWLDQRAGGARVVTETYGLPIDWSGGPPSRGYHLQRVAALADPAVVRRQACSGTRFFLTASLIADHGMPRRVTGGETGRDLLTRLGRIAATFDPFRPGVTASAHPDDTGIPFWHLDAYARPGPVVTIFELSEAAVPCP